MGKQFPSYPGFAGKDGTSPPVRAEVSDQAQQLRQVRRNIHLGDTPFFHLPTSSFWQESFSQGPYLPPLPSPADPHSPAGIENTPLIELLAGQFLTAAGEEILKEDPATLPSPRRTVRIHLGGKR